MRSNIIVLVLFVCLAISVNGDSVDDFLEARSLNPFKMLGCIKDKDCKSNEYCDHTGINPVGKCAVGKANQDSCIMDRYCRSKNCHHLKCVANKPIKDGNVQ